MRPIRFLLLAAFAATLTALPAYAQNPDAVAHFKRGKDLRDEGKCKEAIPEFRESLKLEESIGGFYNLGFCHEKLGNKQEALDAYTRARDMAKRKNDDRLKEIGGARDLLLQTSPHITLTLPDPLPPSLSIKVDGAIVPPTYYAPGETVIFTPKGGSHVVHVSAPGYEERTYTISDERAVPITPQRLPEKVTPEAPPKQEGWMWQHWAGLGGVVVGTGLMVYSIASYIGYDVRRRRFERNFDNACQPEGDPDPSCSEAQAEDQRHAREEYDTNEDNASSSAPLWIGVGGFGALMVIGGVALMVLAPIGVGSPKTVGTAKVQLVPQLGPYTQGLGLTGTF